MMPEHKMVEMVTIQGIRYRPEEAPKVMEAKPVKKGPGRPRKVETKNDAERK